MEVSKWEIESILSKTVNKNLTDWSKKIRVWERLSSSGRTRAQGNVPIPVGVRERLSSYGRTRAQGNVGLEELNLNWDVAANLWVAPLNGLDEFQYHAYESCPCTKKEIKYLHDKCIWNKELKTGDLGLVLDVSSSAKLWIALFFVRP
ncbi:uncharacterized protein [Nicotiana sylvestris]|uniref:uncharacterized protein n=1 Tax=Nicotiana sylvestris TaxID=4096 RepID=UPI00388C531E